MQDVDLAKSERCRVSTAAILQAILRSGVSCEYRVIGTVSHKPVLVEPQTLWELQHLATLRLDFSKQALQGLVPR